MANQIVVSGLYQTLLLAHIDGIGAAAKASVGPQADLGKHQHITVAGNDIDFTTTTGGVASDDSQPLADEKICGGLLCLGT